MVSDKQRKLTAVAPTPLSRTGSVQVPSVEAENESEGGTLPSSYLTPPSAAVQNRESDTIPRKENLIADSFEKRAEGKKIVQGLGWTAIPFIFGGESGERLGAIALQINLINFLIFQMNMPLARAANLVTDFFAATCLCTVGGAFLADAYLGRCMTIIGGSLFYLAGLIVFTLSASMPSLRPASCTLPRRFQGHCQQANSLQVGVLYTALLLQCIGSAAVRPCAAPFGADQFNKSNKKHTLQLRHYFNWYYLCIGSSFLVAYTLIVYLQDDISWGWAQGVCAVFMGVSLAIFLLGLPLYKYVAPTGSPLTIMAQVLVGALRKHKHILPDNPDHLYEARQYQQKELSDEQEVLTHTDNFRFLDKAAIKEDMDAEPDIARRLHPWRLSTVQRVEELKILLRMVPVWLSSILVATVIVQAGTFSVQQALTMNTHMGKLHIPPASMAVFSIIILIVFIPIYDLILVKMLQKITGHPKGLSYLQRIGVGLFLAMISMIASALVEIKRRRIAHDAGLMILPPGSALPISGFWLVPQFVVMGLAESFVVIGQLEFFYDEAPVSMRSMSNAFLWTALGLGSFISSAFVSIIQSITRHNQGGWLQSNINRGHLDRWYWFLAVISALNCIAFVFIARWYICKTTNLPGYDSSCSDDEKSLPNQDTQQAYL